MRPITHPGLPHALNIHPTLDIREVRHSIEGLDDFNKNIRLMNRDPHRDAFSHHELIRSGFRAAHSAHTSAVHGPGQSGRSDQGNAAESLALATQSLHEVVVLLREFLRQNTAHRHDAPHHAHSAHPAPHTDGASSPPPSGLSPEEWEDFLERKKNDPSGTGPTIETPHDPLGRARAFVDSLTPTMLDTAGVAAEAMSHAKQISESQRSLLQSLVSVLDLNHSNSREIIRIIRDAHASQQGMQQELSELKRSLANLHSARNSQFIFSPP